MSAVARSSSGSPSRTTRRATYARVVPSGRVLSPSMMSSSGPWALRTSSAVSLLLPSPPTLVSSYERVATPAAYFTSRVVITTASASMTLKVSVA